MKYITLRDNAFFNSIDIWLDYFLQDQFIIESLERSRVFDSYKIILKNVNSYNLN